MSGIYILLFIFSLLTYNRVNLYQVSIDYKVQTFNSESEMQEAISGHWQLLNQDICFDNGIMIDTDLNDGNIIDKKEYLLDWENGKIIFEGSDNHWDLISHGQIYLRINPKAKSPDNYFLFTKV